jgi:hypothetical protein
MLINISALYAEVNINFKISHKVLKLIMEKLNGLNLSSNNKKKTRDREYIGFIISTKENCNEHVIYKPKYYRNSKFITIDMYLPYLNESDEKTYVKHFLENIEYAIINGLKQLEIEDERIKYEFEKIKEEVIGMKIINIVEE